MPLSTGHVGLNVVDLDRSVAFYAGVFGWDVLQQGDSPKPFAFLGDEVTLFVTLWQQATGGFPTDRAGLHHLSFEVTDIADVEATEARVRELGARIHHGGIVPHGEGASSGGIFFEDPDGTRLEVYAPSGADMAPAPAGTAPTCGFF